MQFEVKNADLLTFEGAGIVLPTISDGTMREGLAGRVRRIVGDEIEAEVMTHAPIAVGAALSGHGHERGAVRAGQQSAGPVSR